MQKWRQALSIGLCAALAVGMLGGCTKSKTQGSSSANTSNAKVPDYMNAVGQFPITKDKITVKAMVSENSEMAKDWNTMEAFKKLEQLTYIHWDFEYVNSANFLNQLSVRFSGNDLPEVCLMGGMSTDTEETYGPTGKLADLTDLIDKYAPHLKKVREKIPEIKLAGTASDGKVYGLPCYAESSANVPALDFFDEKYMNNVGITKIPTTTDELYTMLKAFKEKDMNKDGKNDDIPMSTIASTAGGCGSLRQVYQTAFQGYTGGNASDNWDVDSKGKVIYLPQEKGYKEYLAYMHKLYAEGLLDHDFDTQTSDQIKAKIQSGKVGVYVGQTPTILAGTALANDKQVCMPPLTTPTNSKKVALAPTYLSTTNGVITTACKHKEAVMSWFDLFYRTEDEAVDGFCGKTSLLGYEGEQWKYTDSAKTQYQFIDPVKSYVQLNQTVMITFGLPAYISNMAVQTGNTLMQDKIQGNKDQKASYYKKAYPVNARLTKDEADQSATLTTDLDNYVNMMETKFINGQEDLNKFDDFVKNLDKYGVKDLKKIKQAAYDRYEKAAK